MANTAVIDYERRSDQTGRIPEIHRDSAEPVDLENGDFMSPDRVRKRQKERARIMGRGPFGFSRKTWPFVKVLVGNWIFSLVYYIGMKQIIPWRPDAWTAIDRLVLMIQCSILAVLPTVLAIAIVAAQRLNPDMWVGQKVKPNSALDINTRFILNTTEQVYPVHRRAGGYCALCAAHGRPFGADPDVAVPDRTRPVLVWLPQEPIFEGVWLRPHLLPHLWRLHVAPHPHVYRLLASDLGVNIGFSRLSVDM